MVGYFPVTSLPQFQQLEVVRVFCLEPDIEQSSIKLW
jgi:hypothetical protein